METTMGASQQLKKLLYLALFTSSIYISTVIKAYGIFVFPFLSLLITTNSAKDVSITTLNNPVTVLNLRADINYG